MSDSFDDITRLLREANARIEPPADLLSAIETAAAAAALRRDRMRRFVGAGLAAAALVALVVTVWIAIGPRTPIEGPRVHVQEASSPTRVARVDLPADGALFAQPLASENPNVTIVLIRQDILRPDDDDCSGEPTDSEGNEA